MSKYDLTWRLADFLDPHLIIPLFEFLADRKMYDIKEVLKVRSEFLCRTSMVDELIDTYVILKEPVPPELYERRKAVIESRTSMQDQIVEEMLCVDCYPSFFQFHPDMLDMLYRFAQLQYDCGDYAASSEYLYFYRLLVSQHHNNYLSALWGKVASTILQQHWDTAREDLLRLKAYIDNNPFETELELLHQRAWFIHWGLFVYFNSKKGIDEIVETFLNPNIQTLCPHILRYLTAAVIINKKKKQCLKELVRIIQVESYHYRDSVTEFVECLYVHYNFDGAQQKLRECEEVLANDFFLVACLNEFIESARLLIFEMYCRIHQCISIRNIAEKLNMTPEESEKWIVNLIRNARLDAKIDAKLGLVVMGTKAVSVYEQVMENTKLLSFRAQSLAFQIEKLQSEKQKSTIFPYQMRK
ncbi:unnamed protein product [Soboliphyme baturini]|uniref:Eukaryotic translation initiation factor 3 subunit E n=1 Tax=Soboliphyme baturini TaxID=241478 RepID=A0A183IEV2_9BILA|nr:unnamed protein product [Soboliphyme baturini]